MTINDFIGNPAFYPPVSKAVRPVHQPAPVSESTQKQAETYSQNVLTTTRAARETIQAKADLLMQRNASGDGLSNRSRLAIASYRSLEESEERESIRSMLGVDEYA